MPRVKIIVGYVFGKSFVLFYYYVITQYTISHVNSNLSVGKLLCQMGSYKTI